MTRPCLDCIAPSLHLSLPHPSSILDWVTNTHKTKPCKSASQLSPFACEHLLVAWSHGANK